MTTNRDDLVIRPRVGGAGSPTRRVAPPGGQSRPTAAARRASIMRRLLKMRTIAGVAGGAARGISGVLRMGARGASVAGLLVAAGVVAARLGTGRSFENMGEVLKDAVLGDAAVQMAATKSARDEILADPYLRDARADRSHVAYVFDTIKKRREREFLGVKAFMVDPRFQVDNTLDMVILRARDKVLEAWNRHNNGGM